MEFHRNCSNLSEELTTSLYAPFRWNSVHFFTFSPWIEIHGYYIDRAAGSRIKKRLFLRKSIKIEGSCYFEKLVFNSKKEAAPRPIS